VLSHGWDVRLAVASGARRRPTVSSSGPVPHRGPEALARAPRRAEATIESGATCASECGCHVDDVSESAPDASNSETRTGGASGFDFAAGSPEAAFVASAAHLASLSFKLLELLYPFHELRDRLSIHLFGGVLLSGTTREFGEPVRQRRRRVKRVQDGLRKRARAPPWRPSDGRGTRGRSRDPCSGRQRRAARCRTRI
jgi:hypothetical protein